MIRISRHGDPPGTWKITSSFSIKLRDSCRETPGMRFDYEVMAWIGYPDAVELACKRLKEKGAKYKGLRAMRESELSSTHQLPVAYKKLREYQKVGVDFLVAHGESGVLLADEMGVGKSAQAVRAARAFRKKTVIVCLPPAVGVWAGNDYMESQVKKWWPLVAREGSLQVLEGVSLPTHRWRVWRDGKKLQTATVQALEAFKNDGGPATWRCTHCGQSQIYTPKVPDDANCSQGLPRPSTRFVIVHYEILYAWVDYLLGVWGAGTVIFDELHEVQGERARRTAAVRQLARGCAVRIGLTGTPMPNKPKDLFQTMSILSPGRFGERLFAYGMRYCAGHQVQVSLTKVVYDWKGRSNEEELRRRLRYCMLRRTKKEVQRYLPAKIREIIDVKIPARACVSLDLSVLKRSAVARKALALSADAKYPFVIEALKSHALAGRIVIVFAHRKLVVEHIADSMAAAGIPSSFINGNVPQKDRDRRIAVAKESEGGYVLACTYETCSTSIDLSFASTACFVELSYEPHVIMQTEDRLHRHGQKNTVNLQFFIGRGSIDDLIAQAVISKLDTFEAVIGNSGNTLAKDLDSAPKGRAALDALYETLRNQRTTT